MEAYEMVGIIITIGIFIIALVSSLVAILSFTGARTNHRLSKLEAGQVRFEAELKEIKFKLDQLLARKS